MFHSISSKEQSSFNFMAVATVHSDFWSPRKENLSLFPLYPICLPWSDGKGSDGFIFFEYLVLSQFFALSSFILIKRLFTSSLLSAIWVVLSEYPKLLMFFPTVLIPACDSSSPAFHLMISACKLNKQGDNIQPWCTPFPFLKFTMYRAALVSSP